jgi:hypothetical protein
LLPFCIPTYYLTWLHGIMQISYRHEWGMQKVTLV